MARRNRMRSRISLCVALVVTGTLFYSMLTWMPAVAADWPVSATFAGGFDPDPVQVAPVDSTITFMNDDSVASGFTHNLVPDGTTPLDEAFSGPCNIAPGETCNVTANQIPNPIGYDYHCTIHPTMTGTVQVIPGAEPPGGSASPSASGSASPTASQSASPSPTQSQSPSPSPSESASPSPSPTPEPEGIVRTVTLNLKKHLKAKGKVEGPDDPTGACIEDVEVTIQKKRKHKKGWKNLEDTAQTDADGKYSLGIPDKQGRYRAKIEEETRGLGLLICSAAKSEPDVHKHQNRGRSRR